MPIVPQYQAESPAAPTSPLLQTEGLGQVAPSQEAQALRGLAQSFREQGNAAQLPTVSPDFGQAGATAIQSIAQGASQLGDAIFAIREREAKARNLRDVSRANMATEAFLGEFTQWQEQNRDDPEKWEGEFHRQAEEFRGNYVATLDVSPAAKEAIEMNVAAALSSSAVRVGVDSVKAVGQQAHEAGMANYLRAIESQDATAAKQQAQLLYDIGRIGEDDLVRLQTGADDMVEAEAMKTLDNTLTVLMNEGSYDAAVTVIEQSALPDGEKRAQISGVRKRQRTQGYNEEIRNEAAYDPDETLKKLNAVDKEGRHLHWSELPPADRKRQVEAIEAERKQDISADIVELKTLVEGGTEDIESIGENAIFQSLPEEERNIFRDWVEQGALNDQIEFSSFRDQVQRMDLARDPVRAAEMRKMAAYRFSDQFYDDAVAAIEERVANPMPVTPHQRVLSESLAMVREQFENERFGRFEFTLDEIEVKEDPQTGAPIYVVRDPNPPKGFGFTDERFGFRSFLSLGILSDGEESYRRIQLSPKQVRDLARGEDTTYVDQAFRNIAGARMLEVEQQLLDAAQQGETPDRATIETEMFRLFGLDEQDAFDRFYDPQSDANLDGIDRRGANQQPSAALFPGSPTDLSQRIREMHGNL